MKRQTTRERVLGARGSWARALPLAAGACVLVALGLTAGFVSSAAAHTSGAGVIAGSATFSDPAGDATGKAPDLTSVVINGDPATGLMTVSVTAVGYSAVSPDTYPMVKVYLNTDRNVATGAPNQLGSEYYLAVFTDARGRGWNLTRWNGSAWEFVPASTSSTQGFSRSGDVMTWTISTADLGGSGAFAFFVWSSTWDANDNLTGEDEAPNSPEAGTWTYDISAATPPTTTSTAPTTTTTPTTTASASAPPMTIQTFLTPVIGKPVTVPARVVAGKRITVSFPVTRSDDKKPLTAGTMICDPSVVGKVIRHAESFRSGVARLSFVVPITAKGKQLKVKVTIKAPSYKGKEGTYIDATTGLTGTLSTEYLGQSSTKIVNLPVR